MLVSMIYAVVCWLVDVVLRATRAEWAEAIELFALRHKVHVLCRQVQRTQWRPGDRLLLAALSLWDGRTSAAFTQRARTRGAGGGVRLFDPLVGTRGSRGRHAFSRWY